MLLTGLLATTVLVACGNDAEETNENDETEEEVEKNSNDSEETSDSSNGGFEVTEED